MDVLCISIIIFDHSKGRWSHMSPAGDCSNRYSRKGVVPITISDRYNVRGLNLKCSVFDGQPRLV